MISKDQRLLEEAYKKVVDPGLPYYFGEGGDCIWTRKKGDLQGAPEVVEGSFRCVGHGLTRLKGAPREVGGGFFCHSNRLRTLEGAPQKVGGDFFCDNNDLESLEGAPEKVGGLFSCCFNPSLKSLEGIPEAADHEVPFGFGEKDVQKELEKRRFRQSLDKDTLDTFGDFVAEL